MGEIGALGNLGEVAKVFLVPSSILVAALGAARTEGLKTGVSVLGVVTSALWIWGVYLTHEPLQDSPVGVLPFICIFCWFGSSVLHALEFFGGYPPTIPLPKELSSLSKEDASSILRAYAIAWTQTGDA